MCKILIYFLIFSVSSFALTLDQVRANLKKNSISGDSIELSVRTSVSTSRAETKYLTLNGMGNYIGAVSLNPYTEENYRFVLHELGHLLGLEDVEDLSNLGLKNKESSEGNLMFKFDQNGVKLRNRPMLSKDGTHYEKQWDCLHRLSESDCADSRQWEID